MALVAYDYGSDSEGDDDDEPSRIIEKPTSRVEPEDNEVTSSTNGNTLLAQISDEEDDTISGADIPTSSMFDKLPQKRKLVSEISEDKVEDFIPKAEIITKQKSKIRISVPSLSDFEDLKNTEPFEKKLKLSAKGSGLLSLLPPVKSVPLSNKSFVPNVLTQKNKIGSDQTKKCNRRLIPNSVKKNTTELKKKEKMNESDDSDEDAELPETFDEELWQKTCGKTTKKDIIEEEPIVDEPVINLAPEPVQPYEGLDNKAFKELVGKRSRIPRNIKLIDVNEDELVAEKDLWMTKSLTDPEFVPKSSTDDSVDPTKRKKHHITYLAQQAKANEQELQSQWSSGKFNRNQSRAKYGF